MVRVRRNVFASGWGYVHERALAEYMTYTAVHTNRVEVVGSATASGKFCLFVGFVPETPFTYIYIFFYFYVLINQNAADFLSYFPYLHCLLSVLFYGCYSCIKHVTLTRLRPYGSRWTVAITLTVTRRKRKKPEYK